MNRLLVILALGTMAPTAESGMLSMRFAGGGSEVTLGPSDTATVEVLFQFNATDTSRAGISWVRARFDVGDLAPGEGGQYVQDSSQEFVVTDIQSPVVVWDTWESMLGPFNRQGFFASAGDVGVAPIAGNGTEQPPFVVLTFTIQKIDFQAGDTYVVFRQEDPLPGVYNGSVAWTNRFTYGYITGRQQFLTGQGNPGDADPRWPYHGYETLQPLVIHSVPEPSIIALVVGTAAVLLRSSRGSGRIRARL